MPSEAFNRIKQGLIEAIAYAKGDATGAITHLVEVPDQKSVTPGKQPPKQSLLRLLK